MIHRHIEEEIKAFLKIMPVTLIIGARQTGKTTLLESLAKEMGFFVITFDDELHLSHARQDPMGWLMSMPKPLAIDEIQRLPEIFLSIKRDIDQNRIPGRYLLTGSANPLLLPKLGDSLAGRMGIVTLFPFSQGELAQKKESFIARIFQQPLVKEEDHTALDEESLLSIFLRGGFPPLQTLQEENDIYRWMQAYLQTMIERDVRDIANIEGLRDLPRLFRLLAARSGGLLNVSDISRSMGMVHMTLHRYIKLLEAVFFVYLLPAWFSNQGKRLVKSPKLHICDTAIQAQLLGVNRERLKKEPALIGQFLESFVFSELLKQKSWSSIPVELYHFRDGDYEVDFVLEDREGNIVGIEVKKSAFISSGDLKGLKHLQALAPKQFKRGVVLHLGKQITPLGGDFFALSIHSLWSQHT